MSASFAKAVMPRFKKNGQLQKEPEWDPGWVYPIKIDHCPDRDMEALTDSQLHAPPGAVSLIAREETNLKDCP